MARKSQATAVLLIAGVFLVSFWYARKSVDSRPSNVQAEPKSISEKLELADIQEVSFDRLDNKLLSIVGETPVENSGECTKEQLDVLFNCATRFLYYLGNPDLAGIWEVAAPDERIYHSGFISETKKLLSTPDAKAILSFQGNVEELDDAKVLELFFNGTETENAQNGSKDVSFAGLSSRDSRFTIDKWDQAPAEGRISIALNAKDLPSDPNWDYQRNVNTVFDVETELRQVLASKGFVFIADYRAVLSSRSRLSEKIDRHLVAIRFYFSPASNKWFPVNVQFTRPVVRTMVF